LAREQSIDRGMGKDAQDFQKLDEASQTFPAPHLDHPTGNPCPDATAESDSLSGSIQETPDGGHLGKFEELPSEDGLGELNDNRFMGPLARGARAPGTPHMRQVRTREHQISGLEGGNVITDESFSLASRDQGQLVLGMIVPEYSEARLSPDLVDEGRRGRWQELLDPRLDSHEANLVLEPPHRSGWTRQHPPPEGMFYSTPLSRPALALLLSPDGFPLFGRPPPRNQGPRIDAQILILSDRKRRSFQGH
jgi:hypothetical protein